MDLGEGCGSCPTVLRGQFWSAMLRGPRGLRTDLGLSGGKASVISPVLSLWPLVCWILRA